MIISLQKGPDGNILPFETKKHKYIPIKPGSPMGMRRYSEYQKLSVLVGLDFSFEGMLSAFEHIEKTVLADTAFSAARQEVVLFCNSIRQKVVDTGTSRAEKAFIMATLFFIRDNEDPAMWSMEWAEEIVEDWKNAGISEQDILFFCLSRISGLKEAYDRVLENQKSEAAKLSASFG